MGAADACEVADPRCIAEAMPNATLVLLSSWHHLRLTRAGLA